MKASTKEENLIVLYPERIKGAKDHSTKSLQGVEDYVISTNAFAYLNDKGEVVMKADGDTLVVPTYVLRYTELKVMMLNILAMPRLEIRLLMPLQSSLLLRMPLVVIL